MHNRIKIPPPNSDPCTLVAWIETVNFPFEADEKDLLRRVNKARYTSEMQSVVTIHEVRILYWQVIGWLRKKR